MTTMTFDKLAYIDRLKAAGFSELQTCAVANGLDQALRGTAVTKDNLPAETCISRSGLRAVLFLAIAAQTAVFLAFDLLGR